MKNSAFVTALCFYARVLAGVLAAVGIGSIIALQTGWLSFSGAENRTPQIDTQAPDEGLPPVVATGSTIVMSQMIPVNSSQTYDISAEVRNVAPAELKDRAANTYLGVATFDAEGKEIRGGPGTYRYAGALNYQLYSDAGWRTLSGSITGEGNETHMQFRPGTKHVRIVLLLNYITAAQQNKNGDTVTELRNVRFAPRLNMRSNK